MNSNESQFVFSGAAGKAEFQARGKNALAIFSPDGAVQLQLGRVQCGKFSELSALPEKFRRHLNESELEVEVESSGVIPFGCEYRIDRSVRLADGLALLTTDIAAVTGGQVGNLALETLTLPGQWSEVAFQAWPGKLQNAINPGAGELYRGNAPLNMLRARRDNGFTVEFYLGSDLWRHQVAQNIAGAHSEFTLQCDETGLHLFRELLIYDPEAEIEKRSWRFEGVLAWGMPETSAVAAGTELTLPGCYAARATKKFLRDQVRKAQGVLQFKGGLDDFCTDAAHLDRPRKRQLPHLAIDDAVKFYLWGNRQLQARELGITLLPTEHGILKDSIIMANLGKYPGSVAEIQGE